MLCLFFLLFLIHGAIFIRNFTPGSPEPRARKKEREEHAISILRPDILLKHKVFLSPLPMSEGNGCALSLFFIPLLVLSLVLMCPWRETKEGGMVFIAI